MYNIFIILLLIGPFRNITMCPLIKLKQLSTINITENISTNNNKESELTRKTSITYKIFKNSLQLFNNQLEWIRKNN